MSSARIKVLLPQRASPRESQNSSDSQRARQWGSDPARISTFRTLVASHWPPRDVITPLAVSSALIWCRLLPSAPRS
jgi:hypothetical protein